MFNDYQVDEGYFNNNFKAGEWECTITKVEEKISKKNNPMLALSFTIDEQGTLYYYIVDDVSSEDAWRRRNQNLTRFFDCFSIQRGDFNYNSWIGKRGIIKIDKRAPNENGEQKGFEVKALIVPQQMQQNNNNGAYPQQRNTTPNHPTYPQQGRSRPHPQGQRAAVTNGYQSYNQTPPQNGYQQRPSAYQGAVPQDTQTATTDPENFDNIPF
ncbi:hypothetical protein GWP43_04625 [Treponema vincentii]|uniref:DUF669 domain-containing protein n=1 Tax=Treponema vincentii TaxID=69710 RepID=A0A6P1XZ41_9SPIR|nr:hypothetical protein [Treponema vincentii]QHX42846.1 hypothetical protein GWP43_04625 [Treponema vincentii]